jgi:hypothetical protein
VFHRLVDCWLDIVTGLNREIIQIGRTEFFADILILSTDFTSVIIEIISWLMLGRSPTRSSGPVEGMMRPLLTLLL